MSQRALQGLGKARKNGVLNYKTGEQRGEQQLQNLRKGSPLLSPSSSLLKYTSHRAFYWLSLFLFIGCGNSFSI